MKKLKVIALAAAALLLLAACGSQAIERDAQYKMGDLAETPNGEFGVSSTEVIEDGDGAQQVLVSLAVVNTTADIMYIDDLGLDYYSPAAEANDYTRIENEGSIYLLPGGYSLATLEMEYTMDGTYYLSFDDENDEEVLYALEVKKGEVIEKPLPEVSSTANADLATNVQKGVPSGLGALEFTFGDTESYTWQTNVAGSNNDFLKIGLHLTIKNTSNSDVDFSEYDFYELYTFTDNTVDFSTASTQLGSDDDDVVEIGEIGSINPNGSVDVVLMLSTPIGASDKTEHGHYIQIVFDGQKLTYKI